MTIDERRRSLVSHLTGRVVEIGGGCHIARDTVASIARAGFAVERCDRFMHAGRALEPAIPHVLGTARRTG